MATIVPVFYAKSDRALVVALVTVESPSGDVVPLTTGDVSAFLAQSDDPEAEAADPTLVGSVVYTGEDGDWLIKFDGSQLTVDLMDEKFATTSPWLIIEQEGGQRAAIKCKYSRSQIVPATTS